MKANCFLLPYNLQSFRTYGVLPTLNSCWRWGGRGDALTFCKAVIGTQRWSLMKNNGGRKGHLVLSIFACLYFTDLLNSALYLIFVYHCVLILLLLLFRALLCKEILARFPYSPRTNYLHGFWMKETIGILQKSLSDYLPSIYTSELLCKYLVKSDNKLSSRSCYAARSALTHGAHERVKHVLLRV